MSRVIAALIGSLLLLGCTQESEKKEPPPNQPSSPAPSQEAVPPPPEGVTRAPIKVPTPEEAKAMLEKAAQLGKDNPVATLAWFKYLASEPAENNLQFDSIMGPPTEPPPPGETESILEVALRKIQQIRDYIDRTVGPEIFDGLPAKDLFPECVAIGRWDSDFKRGGWCCSGVLIAENQILTAEHCFDKECINDPRQEGPLTNVWIYFGPGGHVPGTAVRATYFQRFNGTRLENARDDLAIITIPSQSQVTPVPLASGELIKAAKEITVVGFGLTEEGKSGEKRYAPVAIALHSCATANAYGCFTSREFVASGSLIPSSNRPDTCRGDSGGPAFVSDGSGQRFLAGITSSGVLKNQTTGECGDGGLYVRLDEPAYLDWIGKRP